MSDDLPITGGFRVPGYAIELSAIRASGPGGQAVNKTSSAVQLRCDLNSFYIPEHLRQRIARHRDSRITAGGVVVITAREHRSQSRNRAAARERLQALLRAAIHTDPPRRRTRPSRSSVRCATAHNKRRSAIKALRKPPKPGEGGLKMRPKIQHVWS